MTKNIVIIIETLLLVLAAWWVFRPAPQHICTYSEIRTDTIRDTITRIRPIAVSREVVRTIRVPVTDTIHIRDTAFIELPIETKVYKDSTYEAHISGYRPSLDSIRVFTRRVIETRQIAPKKASRWGVGVTAGYGATPKGLLPFVGAGIIYKIWQSR